MFLTKKRPTATIVPVGLSCLLVAAMAVVAFAQTAPVYEFDPTWPKLPLPNQWTFGGVTGLTVDSNDVVWIAHRPNNLDETENYATFDPPRAECCVRAPAILAFNASGVRCGLSRAAHWIVLTLRETHARYEAGGRREANRPASEVKPPLTLGSCHQ